MILGLCDNGKTYVYLNNVLQNYLATIFISINNDRVLFVLSYSKIAILDKSIV